MAFAQTFDTSTPDSLVKNMAAGMINTINSNPSIRKEDLHKISAVVRRKF